jgi:single-strand DNA-binding protein
MSDINHVVLVGRLTRDAELKFTNSGLAIAKLSLAVNRRVKKEDTWQEEGNFFDAVMMGKRAEALAQYLQKGKQIAVEGELRQDRWEQDGQRRSRVEIFVTNIQLLGGRTGAPAAEPAGGEEQPPQGAPTADNFDDDIPF